jgi:hypothetical protein
MKTVINYGCFDYSAKAVPLINKNTGENFPQIIYTKNFLKRQFGAAKPITAGKII